MKRKVLLGFFLVLAVLLTAECKQQPTSYQVTWVYGEKRYTHEVAKGADGWKNYADKIQAIH